MKAACECLDNGNIRQLDAAAIDIWPPSGMLSRVLRTLRK
jgi:hypothetical protein